MILNWIEFSLVDDFVTGTLFSLQIIGKLVNNMEDQRE